MPEITASIIVEPINLTVTQDNPGLGVTVDSTNLNIYTATSLVGAGGSVGELQYHAAGNILAGASTTSVDANGNVTFSNLSNVKIGGGTNGYFLQTDGIGNLVWAEGTANITGNGTPSGANTQIQLSDGAGAFDSGAGFTFDKLSNILSVPGNVISTGIFNGDGGGLSNIVGGNVIGVVPSASFAIFATTANNVAGSNVSGEVAFAAIANTVAGANVSGEVAFAATANNVAGSNVSGEVAFAATANAVAGANVSGAVANATHAVNADSATTAGTVTTAAQPNITSVGTLTGLDISGNLNISSTTSIYEAIENVNLIGAQTGTYNFDLLNGSIQYSTANASANLILNFRGNSTIMANTMLANGKSITSTYILTTGSTPYEITDIQIDSVVANVKWAGGSAPTIFANAQTAFTYTIIKTSTSPTYDIFASATRYL